MIGRQVRIFAPSDLSIAGGRHWAESILGNIVRPMVRFEGQGLRWFWFSRYSGDNRVEVEDCDYDALPEAFRVRDWHRSVRFRYGIFTNRQEYFETELARLIHMRGYAITGCLDYDYIADLGSERFIDNVRDKERVEHRARLVRDMLSGLGTVALDSLVPGDGLGEWRYERRMPGMIHHLVCNILDPELMVTVYQNGPGDTFEVMGGVGDVGSAERDDMRELGSARVFF